MSEIKYENVPAELVKQVPEFEDVYEDHVTFYEEIIPYVLFGSLMAFFVEVYQASAGKRDQLENADDVLQRLSNFLRAVQNLRIKRLFHSWWAGFLRA